MSTLTRSAAIHRRLTLRRRRDLKAVPQHLQGESIWALKDPVALQYFHLRDPEYWVFSQLDGTVSLADLQTRFAEQFAPQRLSLSELQSFLGTLHQAGLVLADVPGQGEELLRRSREQKRRRWLQTLANPLAIRFRGFDPDRLLNLLSPLADRLLSRGALLLSAMLVLGALVLVAARFEVLQARLPDREVFFGASNLAWLGVTLALTKVLHELGHALTLKRQGGECHEMGVMLLVFTPCLYCNVSDAWMLPGKWQRAAVGAAGIGVELVLAAVCTFLWWFSQPGLLNALCLNVMFVCSVSTLLINGNPLLRYDGYYVLADLTETPNLSAQASAILRSDLAALLLGVDLRTEQEPRLGRRAALALYAGASVVYRSMLLFGVLWYLYKTLQPHRLEVLAAALSYAAAAGFVIPPLLQFGRFLSNPVWRRLVRWRRAAVSSLLIMAAAALLLGIPWPHRIRTPALLQAMDARRIYAAVPGRLVEGREEGSLVRAGETVARLENSDLQLEIERLTGQVDQQRLRVETLKRRQIQDAAAAAELPTATELLSDLMERLSRKQVDRERLTLTAPVGGTVLPPHPHESAPQAGTLPAWSGTPLDPRNRGCALDTGTLVCLIGDPNRLEALLVIDQADMEFVAVGQRVRIQLEQSPGTLLSGTIHELAELDLKITPPQLLAAGELANRPDERGVARPASTSYQARVRLEGAIPPLLLGESGRARIDAASLSLGSRLLRAIRLAFSLDLAPP